VLALWLMSCHGQTRLTWQQLRGFGATRPPVVWQAGLKGVHIHPAQVQPVSYAFATDPYALKLRVLGAQECTITVNRLYIGLVQVVLYQGQVGILAGHYEGDIYKPTVSHVTIDGPCVPVDTVDGRYPLGIHAFLYFGCLKQPTGVEELRGVEAPFLPTAYNMNAQGLVGVQGIGGQAAWQAPAPALLNAYFNRAVVTPMKVKP